MWKFSLKRKPGQRNLNTSIVGNFFISLLCGCTWTCDSFHQGTCTLCPHNLSSSPDPPINLIKIRAQQCSFCSLLFQNKSHQCVIMDFSLYDEDGEKNTYKNTLVDWENLLPWWERSMDHTGQYAVTIVTTFSFCGRQQVKLFLFFILNYIQHEYLYYFFQVGGLQMMVGLNYNMQEVWGHSGPGFC